MTKKPVRNLEASIRARLLNRSKARSEDFNLVLERFFLERLLYRLSKSPHREDFILKGAMLFQAWTDSPYRATRDVDFLGTGGPDLTRIKNAFAEICRTNVDADGVSFLPETLKAEFIREEQIYGGIRVTVEARLAGARMTIQADVGFGDATGPGITELELPCLLDLPAPSLRAYRAELSIAEKFEALVQLGATNSRMKDYFDIWVLARDFTFDGGSVSNAFKATFARRRTPIPTSQPPGLSDAFFAQAESSGMWKGFLERTHARTEGQSLGAVADLLRRFLLPPAAAAADDIPFTAHWKPGGPWE
jgi:hypothetical protein